MQQKTLLEKYGELENDNAVIMSELSHLSDEAFHFKPNEHSWSSAQVLNHLIATETGTLQYIRKKMKYGGIPAVGFSSKVRTMAMKALLYSAIRFKIPQALSQPTSEGSMDSINSNWLNLRKDWKEFLENFPTDHLSKGVFKHPIFGRLSISQTIDSLIAHQAHHKKQLIRIRKGGFQK
ncbi:MAG: DinB family protein [Bacteroidetes bacterium]|nr:DinB family protein [Bacteroidota bacterium]MDA1121448.1 DinB family protein [Bacteroidota bacterium]